MKTILKIALAAGTALALAAPVSAATSTGNLTVNANIAGTCTVAGATMAFGAYTSTVAKDGTATLTVNCTTGVAFNISAGNGANFSTTRRMTSGGSNYLGYNLYTDSARQIAWNTTNQVPGSGTGVDQTVTVYGQIPAGQSALTGSFTDTVLMTITY